MDKLSLEEILALGKIVPSWDHPSDDDYIAHHEGFTILVKHVPPKGPSDLSKYGVSVTFDNLDLATYSAIYDGHASDLYRLAAKSYADRRSAALEKFRSLISID